MTLARRIFKTWCKDDIERACRLYLVTSREWLGKRTLYSCVAEAIVGGVSMVQLRQKNPHKFELAKTARDLAPICRFANVPLVINDDIEVVKSTGVDGVHIGQQDISCSQARRELGESAVVGVTVFNVEDAIRAQEDGATYLFVGPIAKMNNQPDRRSISISEVTEISKSVDIPVVAFGGLNAQNVCELSETGIKGAAFMSPILASQDIEQASGELRLAVDECLG